MSEAIRFIDTKLTQPEDIESTIPYDVLSKYLNSH